MTLNQTQPETAEMQILIAAGWSHIGGDKWVFFDNQKAIDRQSALIKMGPILCAALAAGLGPAKNHQKQANNHENKN
jgi:hypothetical protein